MYIAMNRFRIAVGHEGDFEAVWRERDSYLKDVPGFVSFNLLRGPSADGQTLYVSHSLWDSEDAFVGWTESEEFQKAHGQARTPEGTVLGPPAFEGFKVVLSA